MPTSMPAVVVAFALLLRACAGHGRDPALAPRQSARGSCHPASYPRDLPDLAQLVDTASLRTTLAADAGWRSPAAHALFSLTYDSTGELGDIRVLEAVVPAAREEPAAALQALVRRTGRALAPSDSVLGVRLRVSGGEAVRLELARQVLCAPLARGAAFAAVRANPPGSVRVTAVPQPVDWQQPEIWIQRLQVRVHVAPDGALDIVVPATGPSGMVPAMFSERIDALTRSLTFFPATRDGQAEPGWVNVYATIQQTTSARQR